VTHDHGDEEESAYGSARKVDMSCGRAASAVAVRRSAATRQIASPSLSENVPTAVRAVLTRIAVGDPIASAAFADAFLASVELPAPTRDVVLGSLMTAMMARGPAADDVEALLRVALSVDRRASAEVISGGDRPVLMLAGSGKKGVRTLNVSTPAALVAAAAGVHVIKVGSAATSSALGSRDLVRALGLREHRTADGVRADLAASGFAFVAIEPEIPVLDKLYGGRFHAPNPFSFGLAPLASPVRGDVTVFGLSHPRVEVAARVLSRFAMHHVDVLSTRLPSGHYLDEIGSVGELRWCRVRNGEVGRVEAEPASYLTTTDLPTPHGPEEAIERTGELLAGGGLDSHRALVALNAAHMLVLGGVAATLASGVAIAEDILRSGAALASIRAARTAERSA
jgi:anthranilate phosphoribosyltransferase